MIKYLLSLLTTTALFLLPTLAHAQTYTPSNRTPVADNTLGTQVTGSGNNFNITGGVNKGQTLFHSFTDFSVPTNGAANFLNPAGNRDIITRVTGNLFSDINGLVNSNGANFFLINPNGIVFGTNAQLNVGRAFMASTANGIDLVDGSGRAITFGTNPNGDAPLLSVAPNVLFNASRLNLGSGNGAISNFGTLQTTNPNQYIGLIGGNVSLNGGKVIAPGGKVDLGGLAAPGSVIWSEDKLIFPTSSTRSNVTLTDGASVSVAGSGGGDIAINAQNLNVLNGSELAVGISENAPNSQAGDINIDVLGNIEVGGNSQSVIRNEVLRNAVGNSGNININTDGLRVVDGASITSSTYGTGNAGKMTITAQRVEIDREIPRTNNNAPIPTGLFTQVEPNAIGNAGDITLQTKTLSVSNGGKVQSATFGNGNSGKVSIKADDEIDVFNSPGVNPGQITNINTGLGFDPDRNKDNQGRTVFANGKGGDLTIETGRLSIRNGALVSSDSRGNGDAGKIIIKTNTLQLDGSVISSLTSQNGNAGDIEITTRGDLTITGTTNPTVFQGVSGITSSTYGIGDTGKIIINTQGNKLSLSNQSAILSAIAQKAQGNSKGINIINVGNLILRNGSFIATSNLDAQGNAGDIIITSKGNIDLINNSAITSANIGQGRAANISISSNQLNLNTKSLIATNGFSGNGGDLTLTINDQLLLRNNSGITTDSGSSEKNGNGGNITINSPLIVATPGNNDISANANQGNGGQVNITSQGLFGIQYRPSKNQASLLTNDITASSTFGRDGNVNIDTPGTDPGKDSTELPNAPTDASKQISQVCSTYNRQNKLTVTGRGGLPPTANDPLTSDVIWQDARAASSQPAVSSAKTNRAKLAPPAVGWVFDGKGKVTLVAAGTEAQPTSTNVVCPNVDQH
jgi:filamentous hemagglutinin family protein